MDLATKALPTEPAIDGGCLVLRKEEKRHLGALINLVVLHPTSISVKARQSIYETPK